MLTMKIAYCYNSVEPDQLTFLRSQQIWIYSVRLACKNILIIGILQFDGRSAVDKIASMISVKVELVNLSGKHCLVQHALFSL